MNHLTDEQFAEWLAGETNPEMHSHLEGCPQCHAEALQLRDGISRYAIAVRRQSALSQSKHLAENFAPRKVLAQHYLRWAGTGTLALLLTAQTAWLIKPRHSPAPQPQQTVSVPAQPQPSAATAMSDEELLEAVNNDLSREVPEALAPISAITTARNRIAAASTAAPNNLVSKGESR